MKTTIVLGVKVINEKKEKVLEYLFDRLTNPANKTFIITPNPEMLVYAKKHLDYQDKLNHADISLPDGVGLLLAGEIMGKPIEERITGVDFIEDVCRKASKKPLYIGFLGGKAGIAERTAKCLKTKYPGLNVIFTGSEWNTRGSGWRVAGSNTTQLRATSHEPPAIIDILFVAYGVPKQEEWIFNNLSQLPIKAAMGVGGSFDFLSGNIPRAPQFVRSLGMEWLFRLFLQPWRFKRQLALIEFIFLVLKEKNNKN